MGIRATSKFEERPETKWPSCEVDREAQLWLVTQLPRTAVARAKVPLPISPRNAIAATTSFLGRDMDLAEVRMRPRYETQKLHYRRQADSIIFSFSVGMQVPTCIRRYHPVLLAFCSGLLAGEWPLVDYKVNPIHALLLYVGDRMS